MNVVLNGKLLEEVECLKNLGSHIVAIDGEIDVNVKYRLNEVVKVCGGMKKMFKCESLQMSAKRDLYEGIVASTVVYGG